jgi:hypothetical protein
LLDVREPVSASFRGAASGTLALVVSSAYGLQAHDVHCSPCLLCSFSTSCCSGNELSAPKRTKPTFKENTEGEHDISSCLSVCVCVCLPAAGLAAPGTPILAKDRHSGGGHPPIWAAGIRSRAIPGGTHKPRPKAVTSCSLRYVGWYSPRSICTMYLFIKYSIFPSNTEQGDERELSTSPRSVRCRRSCKRGYLDRFVGVTDR